mgnify:CR=1 FL=1
MNKEKRSSVAERLKYAREHYQFIIHTELVKMDDDYCVMKASIINNTDVIATGHSIEYKRNNVAYVEVAETIAIGRALMLAGITEDEVIASTDELAKAFQQDIEDNTSPMMTLDEALQTRTKSGKRYADLDDSNLQYIVDKATNEKSREAAQIVLNHRNK